MKINSIKIEFIPHSVQRYETPGDWIVDEKDGRHVIRVSVLQDEKMSWLIAFHELAEFMLCMDRGITQESADAFDIQFEKERTEGLHAKEDEAGDDANAPYVKEHSFATGVERLLSVELGVNWKEYDDAVVSLLPKTPSPQA